jgi:predicted MFS family arabinose efflux permease
MVASIGYFGFLAGPPLIGFIAEMFSLKVSFAFIACVGALIGLMAMSLSPAEPKPQYNLR